MLQTSVQLLVIIHVLRGVDCRDSKRLDEEIALPVNITTASLHIVDCFIKAIHTSWKFSVEEALNVSYFQNITHRRCDLNTWRIFQCNYPLMAHLQKVQFLAHESDHEMEEYLDTELFRSNTVEHYENAVELQRQVSQTMEVLIDQMRQIKKEAAARNEFTIFTDDCSLTLLNMGTLMNQSSQLTALYKEMRTEMEIQRLRTYTLRYYFLPFVVVVFTFGMLGNGLLLLVFVRHPKTRMGPNVMLVNLAVSDSLFLLVNIATEYCKMLWGFPFGVEACYIYNFVLGLTICASVYSMTILSFSRYIAVTANPGSSTNRLVTSMPVMLTTVWILSAVVAIPDTLTSTMKQFTPDKAECNYDGTLLNAIFDFLFISLLPFTAITCFYIVALRRLRESVRMMPGQALGQEKFKTARERGAKILSGLIFVFAITFLPYYTYFAIVGVFEIDYDESPLSHTLYFVVYFLFNMSSSLNPISLYLTSGMFRRYINNYITLGMAKKLNSRPGSNISNTESTKL